MATTNDDSHCHAVLFPFMSKGHTIPLLHLAHLLFQRGISVTIFTTRANHSFVAKMLAETKTMASIIDLPFPQNIPCIPHGVESTDQLPSIALFHQFALGTKGMQPAFESALMNLPRVTFMVSDGFLWWTSKSSLRLGFPSFVFYGMSMFSTSIAKAVNEDILLSGHLSDSLAKIKQKDDVNSSFCIRTDEKITLTQFPWINLTEEEVGVLSLDPAPDLHFRFMKKTAKATSCSHGLIVNSFVELEPLFSEHWNLHCIPKAWLVGPLCLIQSLNVHEEEKPTWLRWLDQKLAEGCSVLYIAFGSQAEISLEQLHEISKGLEESNHKFVWVMKKKETEMLEKRFEERVKGRGIIVREWVNQSEILMHESVQGFLSHCGWNSVLESICAGIPIVAWPMMAEQPLNAKMVVEELRVGIKVETCDGSLSGVVKAEELKSCVVEVMEGELGREMRKRVRELGVLAKKAMDHGIGSSWRSLQTLIGSIS